MSTQRPFAPLRRLVPGLIAASAALVAGCANLSEDTASTRRPSLASVTTSGSSAMAWATPSAKPAAEQRSVRLAAASPSMTGEQAVGSDAPSIITRSLLADDLRADERQPRPAEDEGKDAAGAPTDPLRPDTTLNLDDAQANQDLWGRLRRGFALPALADTSLIEAHERWYAARPDYVQRMTDRGSRYLFHVVEEVERRGMPSELALLPFIESAFNPQALSSARASGIWQFMPATGKDFELRQNIFRDDRRDVLASTRAAMDYLQRLHRQFGDWHLALAAYNWGEGNVQRAINRNLKAGLPGDYASLNMPDETRNYVPKLHAVRNIVLKPEAYGLSLPAIENHPYFAAVPIQRDMDMALAARLADLPLADFQALNPSMNKPVILAAGTPQILLPYDNASRFMHNLQRHKGPLATLTAWVVPKTMRPAEAARSVGITEAHLRELNQIPLRMLVKAGSTLLVPRSKHREQDDVSESVADNAMMAFAPDLPPMKRITVKARKRDTVASVAKRYKVSAIQLAQWNKMRVGDSFKRSQAVVVYVPVKAGGTRMASSSGGDRETREVSSRRGKAVAKAGAQQGRRLAASARAERKVAARAAKGAAVKSARASANRQAKVRVATR